MRVEIVTLFPELFDAFLVTSFVGRAVEREALSVVRRSPRDFGLGKHRSVDDTPYGGGSGMVMRVDVLVACMESLDETADATEQPHAHRVLMTPQGAPLTQALVERLAALPALMLVCGRYEGFDDRVRSFVDEEVSLGDFVLTGGEVAAMAVIEGCIRLLPGVLGNQASPCDESHSPRTHGLLEYPQFTRPAEFRGHAVPEPLVSGNHGLIERWRRSESEERTRQRRPDVYARFREACPPSPERKPG
jgi:tRNA (guanine37-N1)-methyltransferase